VRTKTSQGKRARTNRLVHGLKAFSSRRGQVEALHAQEENAAPAPVHAGLLADRRGSDGCGVRRCVRATPPRHSLGPPGRCPGTRTPEQCGTTRGRGKRKHWRTRALWLCVRDVVVRSNFTIPFSKLQNSRKCQHTRKSPKIKFVEEL
jgi:hypothetical protein